MAVNYRTPMAVNTRLSKTMCSTSDSEREFSLIFPIEK